MGFGDFGPSSGHEQLLATIESMGIPLPSRFGGMPNDPLLKARMRGVLDPGGDVADDPKGRIKKDPDGDTEHQIKAKQLQLEEEQARRELIHNLYVATTAAGGAAMGAVLGNMAAGPVGGIVGAIIGGAYVGYQTNKDDFPKGPRLMPAPDDSGGAGPRAMQTAMRTTGSRAASDEAMPAPDDPSGGGVGPRGRRSLSMKRTSPRTDLMPAPDDPGGGGPWSRIAKPDPDGNGPNDPRTHQRLENATAQLVGSTAQVLSSYASRAVSGAG